MLRAGEGSEGSIDEWLELLGDEPAVEIAFTPAEAEVAGWGVFRHAAQAGICDSDEDDGLAFAGGGHSVCCFAGAPGTAGDVGGVGIEEVLPIVEVKDREAAQRVVRVCRRQVDTDDAVIREDCGVEEEAGKAGNAVLI